MITVVCLSCVDSGRLFLVTAVHVHVIGGFWERYHLYVHKMRTTNDTSNSLVPPFRGSDVCRGAIPFAGSHSADGERNILRICLLEDSELCVEPPPSPKV